MPDEPGGADAGVQIGFAALDDDLPVTDLDEIAVGRLQQDHRRLDDNLRVCLDHHPGTGRGDRNVAADRGRLRARQDVSCLTGLHRGGMCPRRDRQRVVAVLHGGIVRPGHGNAAVATNGFRAVASHADRHVPGHAFTMRATDGNGLVHADVFGVVVSDGNGLVVSHRLGLIVSNRLRTIVADILVLIVPNLDAVILLAMHENFFAARLVFETEFVEPAALMRT